MRSVQRHLLVWILSALSIGGMLLIAVSYVIALDELGEVFDENLKQVALATAAHHRFDASYEATPPPRLPNFYGQEGDFDYVTMVWTPDGKLTYVSDPAVVLPFVNKAGLVRLNTGSEEWHIYSVQIANGVVQAAQRASSRAILAAEVASKSFLPTVLLVCVTGVLLVIALRRGLRPLDRAAQDVAARSEASLTPVPDQDLPLELRPLIGSLNGLLRRLDEAFTRERKFVADAAHGLRTPITALRLQVQLVERAPNPAARARAIADLKAGVERSQHLIEQLLELSRLDPEANLTKWESVSLADLVRSTVARLNLKAEHKDVDLGAEVLAHPSIEGDVHQLTILLDNLVANAIRYTPSGGVIDVRVSYERGKPTISVSDSGPGIPEAERERVFDRFYRGSNVPTTIDGAVGSGLGLSIVKAIAARHHASVQLGTPPGRDHGLLVSVSFGHAALTGEQHDRPYANRSEDAG